MSSEFMRKKISFSQIPTSLIRDTKISRKAKGLYCEIFSYITIPNFELKKSYLINNGVEGETAFETIWKELKTAGYLKQYRFCVNENGKTKFVYKYDLLDDPDPDSPYLINIKLDGTIGKTSGVSKDMKKENHLENVPPLKHRECKTNSIQNKPCTPTPQSNYIDDNYIEYNYIDDNHIEYSKKERKRETYDEIIENFSQGNKELEAELKKYLQMRFTKQKRLSNVSLKESLNNLLKVSGNNQVDMIEIVNKAVRKEQLDFYPLSEKEKQPKIEQNTSYDLENYNKFTESQEYFNLLAHSFDKE